MAEIVRFGVSMDKELVSLLDELTIQHHHPNRSETIRSMIRSQLTQESTQLPDTRVTAVISLIYHYSTSLQRVSLSEYPSLTLSTNLQMHLERDIVIKILVVSGRYDQVTQWAGRITGQKQVVGQINIAATDTMYKELRP